MLISLSASVKRVLEANPSPTDLAKGYIDDQIAKNM